MRLSRLASIAFLLIPVVIFAQHSSSAGASASSGLSSASLVASSSSSGGPHATPIPPPAPAKIPLPRTQRPSELTTRNREKRFTRTIRNRKNQHQILLPIGHAYLFRPVLPASLEEMGDASPAWPRVLINARPASFGTAFNARCQSVTVCRLPLRSRAALTSKLVSDCTSKRSASWQRRTKSVYTYPESPFKTAKKCDMTGILRSASV
jgi:hypothetical protein